VNKEYKERRDMNLTLTFFFLGINFTHKHLYIRMKYKEEYGGNLVCFCIAVLVYKGILWAMTCKIGDITASILVLTFYPPTYSAAS
jgi:hypothetical protein